MIDSRALSVVIPSYNARDLLARALETLAAVAPDAEVIVVDGASSDGSAELVERDFPDVVLVRHKNHGFAHATNRGIERATRPLILLMNSDLFITEEALSAMTKRLMEDPKLAAIGPRLVNPDGSRQTAFGFYYWPNWFEVKRPSRIWVLSGACIMTRRDVIEDVGALDESFFLYNEEYDWCARCIKAGYHLELSPERVVHVGGGSTSQSPELNLEAHRGFLYVTRKHTPTVFAEVIRRGMVFECLLGASRERRPEHRAMWLKIAGLAHRDPFFESPFPVSGRGDSVAQPHGLELSELGVGALEVLSPEALSPEPVSPEGREAATSADQSGPRLVPIVDAGSSRGTANDASPRRARQRKPRTRHVAV